jgi:hypothetical protein
LTFLRVLNSSAEARHRLAFVAALRFAVCFRAPLASSVGAAVYARRVAVAILQAAKKADAKSN